MRTISFDRERSESIGKLGRNAHLLAQSKKWMREVSAYKYSYNFNWLGRPIIQFPQDIIAMQEIIWKVKPDLIIETGIARGGSMVFYASMLELIGGGGAVLGVDIDIRRPNLLAIQKHPLSKRIAMMEGSSVEKDTVERCFQFAEGKKKVLLVLDSLHTHEHVLQEMRIYSPLVNKGSYMVVFDTIIEDLPRDFFPDRPWGRGNNPKTAVREFLRTNQRFQIDREIQDKLLITTARDGYLKCIKG